MTTILITGGAGFIAHHFVDYLLINTDWNIVTLDRLDYSGNLNRLAEVLEDNKDEAYRVKVVYHDLKAPLNSQIINTIGPIDYIAHLAAGSHVDRSIEYPLEFVYDNVVGTANILDYARGLDSLEKFVYFSTDEVFGPAPFDIKFNEYDRYNSTNPYSATKAGAEELVVAYHNTYNLPAVITHTMNVFGERQHPEKFIPMSIKKILNGETVTIHSDASKQVAGSRHYIHASDVADALYFILTDESEPDIEDYFGAIKIQKYNIVGAEEVDNLRLAQMIAETLGKELSYEMVDFHSSRPGHDLRYALCGERMKKLGWEPTDFKDRIKETILWTFENDRWLKV